MMDTSGESNKELEWDYQFEEEEYKIDKAATRRTHCVLIYDDDELGEMRWEVKEGEKIFLGRSNGVGTEDKRLSRQQVECHADFDEMKVVVTRIGKHSSLDQQFRPIGAGCTVELSHLDTFWLLGDKYPIYVFIETEGGNRREQSQGDNLEEEEDDMDFKDESSSEESGICSGDED